MNMSNAAVPFPYYFSSEFTTQCDVFLLTIVLRVYVREDNFKKHTQTALQSESGELYDASSFLCRFFCLFVFNIFGPDEHFIFSHRTFALAKMAF